MRFQDAKPLDEKVKPSYVSDGGNIVRKNLRKGGKFIQGLKTLVFYLNTWSQSGRFLKEK